MAKSVSNQQNWYRWNGGLWVNFHDYHYKSGAVLTVVRYAEGRKFSRDLLGKYRTVKGVEQKFRKDDCYKDENPDEWWAWERLVTLRKDLAGADYKATKTVVLQ